MSDVVTTNKSVREMLTDLVASNAVKATLDELLKTKKPQFLSTIVSIVNSDQKLTQVFYDNPMSVLNIAIQIVNLDLPLGNHFGFAYIVPRFNKRLGKNEAQLMLGYKGLLQMAIRSGKYRTIKAIPIHQGEITEIDYLTGRMRFKWNQNPSERSKTPVIGYVGILKFMNGFEYQTFLSREEIVEREKKFRQGTYQSPAWESNFDSMAEKTVIKMMLARYGYVGFGTNEIESSSSNFEEYPANIDLESGEIMDAPDISDPPALD